MHALDLSQPRPALPNTMSPAESSDAPCRFTEEELALLGKTADALTAYSGKPVLAEVGTAESGHEWVAFARPLEPGAALGDDDVRMQMGGPGTRWVGNRGGLGGSPDDVYDCVYLWAIQLSPLPGERYIKLDHQGDEFDWSDRLADLLPFDMSDAPPTDDDPGDDPDD